MRKAILGGVLTVAALVVILIMQGVSLHGMLGDDDDDDSPTLLRALWHLDDIIALTSPTAFLTPDSTGDGNTGVLFDGAQTGVAGRFGSGIATSTGGYMEVGHDPTMEPPSKITVETWVKAASPSAAGTNAYVLSKGFSGATTLCNASYSFNQVDATAPAGQSRVHFDILTTNGPATALARSPSGTVAVPASSAAVFNGAFHHLAGTWDGTTTGLKLYLDGVLQTADGTAPATGFTAINYNQPNRDFYLGRLNGSTTTTPCTTTGANNPFTGTIDESRVWARDLTAGEIAVSVDMGRQTNPPVEIGGGEEASIAFTKRWEVTGAGTANNQVKTFNFDIATSELSTKISSCTIGTVDGDVEVEKAKNATVTSVANPNTALATGKSCTFTVTRLDGTDDADVRFEVSLTTGKELKGRIRIRP